MDTDKGCLAIGVQRSKQNRKRVVRGKVEGGSMADALEIHPVPLLRRNWGTLSSTEAVQITRVLPTSMRAEPSAVEMKSGVMLTGRS